MHEVWKMLMMPVWRRVLSLGLMVTGVFWCFSLIFPAPFASALVAGLRYSANLEEKTILTSSGPIAYLEGPRSEALDVARKHKPTIVLLHGIFARKEHWIDLTRELTDRYHVYVLDLPGFGDNPVLEVGAYDYASQADRIERLLNALKLDKFHIAGNSMGGQLAGMLALRMPERIQSVAFIGSTAGIRSPIRSDMEKAIARNDIPLLVTTPQDFHDRMNWLFPEVPFIPTPIATVWAEEEAVLGEVNRRIWEEVGSSEGPKLQELASQMHQPSLIIWCQEDRVFHISGAAVLHEELPGSELVVLQQCGHVPMMDKPSESGRAYRQFLDRL